MHINIFNTHIIKKKKDLAEAVPPGCNIIIIIQGIIMLTAF